MSQVLLPGYAYFLISFFLLLLYKSRWKLRNRISEKGRKGNLGSSSPVAIKRYDKSKWVSVNKTCRVGITHCNSSLDGMWNLKTWDKLSSRSKAEMPAGNCLDQPVRYWVLSLHLAPGIKTPVDLSPWPLFWQWKFHKKTKWNRSATPVS